MRKILRRRLGLLLLVAYSLSADPIDQIQIWHSSDGRSIEARVLDIDPDNLTVTMERADGFRFTADWSRFSVDAQNKFSEASTMEADVVPQSPFTSSQASRPAGASHSNEPLPDTFELRGVPMVEQKGNFCVPASASMIAGYHGIDTDQDEVAELSSDMSASNRGTYASDMLLAMEKLGFDGQSLLWHNEDDFFNHTLPEIRRSLIESGPVYISFRPGVFGRMGHGCVIVGYNDRREKLYFYNPWGNEFEKEYEDVAVEGWGVVVIDPPADAPTATDDFIRKIQSLLPRFGGDFLQVSNQLSRVNQGHELVWCSRRDERGDKHFARNTARDEGRKILELAFERSPAVLIPHSEDGETEKYYFVTRPPEGGARFMVRVIDSRGWSQPELYTLGSLTRNWVTSFKVEGSSEKVWELPMIELHPDPSL